MQKHAMKDMTHDMGKMQKHAMKDMTHDMGKMQKHAMKDMTHDMGKMQKHTMKDMGMHDMGKMQKHAMKDMTHDVGKMQKHAMKKNMGAHDMHHDMHKMEKHMLKDMKKHQKHMTEDAVHMHAGPGPVGHAMKHAAKDFGKGVGKMFKSVEKAVKKDVASPPRTTSPPPQGHPQPQQQAYPAQGYPPPGTQGYPPPGTQGYPPPASQGYPPSGGYPAQAYPPQNQGYPPAQGYPAPGGAAQVPYQGQQYDASRAPQPQMYAGAPQSPSYGQPPQSPPYSQHQAAAPQSPPPQSGYPPQGYPAPHPEQQPRDQAPPQNYPAQQAPAQGYPPQQTQGYPPQQTQGYPPQQTPAQGYPPHQTQGYPPQQTQGYPQTSAAVPPPASMGHGHHVSQFGTARVVLPPLLTAGEVLCGTVVVNITTPTYVKAIAISVKGHEKMKIVEPQMKADKQELAKRKNDRHVVKEKIIIQPVETTLPVGQFNYPFSFNTTHTFPSTLQYHIGEKGKGTYVKSMITYHVTGIVQTGVHKGDLKARVPLVLNAPVNNPTQAVKAKGVKEFLTESGSLSVSATLNKSFYYPGETIIARLKANSTAVTPTAAVKVDLSHDLQLSGHDNHVPFIRKFSNVVKRETFAGFEPCFYGDRYVALQVPFACPPSSLGQIVTSTHTVLVTCDIRGAFDLMLRLPVTILAPYFYFQQSKPSMPPALSPPSSVSIRPRWQPDVEAAICTRCSKKFWLLERRHHCRHCGMVFCGACCGMKMPIEKLKYRVPVRVCLGCADTARAGGKVSEGVARNKDLMRQLGQDSYAAQVAMGLSDAGCPTEQPHMQASGHASAAAIASQPHMQASAHASAAAIASQPHMQANVHASAAAISSQQHDIPPPQIANAAGIALQAASGDATRAQPNAATIALQQGGPAPASPYSGPPPQPASAASAAPPAGADVAMAALQGRQQPAESVLNTAESVVMTLNPEPTLAATADSVICEPTATPGLEPTPRETPGDAETPTTPGSTAAPEAATPTLQVTETPVPADALAAAPATPEEGATGGGAVARHLAVEDALALGTSPLEATTGSAEISRGACTDACVHAGTDSSSDNTSLEVTTSKAAEEVQEEAAN